MKMLHIADGNYIVGGSVSTSGVVNGSIVIIHIVNRH